MVFVTYVNCLHILVPKYSPPVFTFFVWFPTSLSHIVQVLPNSYKLISWISLLLLLFLDIELLHLFIGSWNCNYEAHLAHMIYLVFMLLGNECYTILSVLCGGKHNATHRTSSRSNTYERKAKAWFIWTLSRQSGTFSCDKSIPTLYTSIGNCCT